MDPAAWLGGISHWFLGYLYCICTPREASLVFLMDEVTLRVSLPLSGAPRGTDQLFILLSALRSGITRVVCFVLAGLHTEGLTRGISVPGSGERGGRKGRGSRRTLPRLPAPAQLCCSLQLMQWDGYVLPCRKSPCSGIWGQYHSSHGSGHGERALRHCHT